MRSRRSGFAMSARGLRMSRSMKPLASAASKLFPELKPRRVRRLSKRPSEVSDASVISAFSGASNGCAHSPVAASSRKTLAGGEAVRGRDSVDQSRTLIKSTLSSGQYMTGSGGRVSV